MRVECSAKKRVVKTSKRAHQGGERSEAAKQGLVQQSTEIDDITDFLGLGLDMLGLGFGVRVRVIVRVLVLVSVRDFGST